MKNHQFTISNTLDKLIAYPKKKLHLISWEMLGFQYWRDRKGGREQINREVICWDMLFHTNIYIILHLLACI